MDGHIVQDLSPSCALHQMSTRLVPCHQKRPYSNYSEITIYDAAQLAKKTMICKIQIVK